MPARYEYKFIRLGTGFMAAKHPDKTDYQQIIERNAADGWRLVQIFSPGVGAYGAARFHELIFERPIDLVAP